MSQFAEALKLRGWTPLLRLSQQREPPTMPHLHLPADHSDADLVLAASLAELVGSDDLFVTWTHRGGPGAVPEVEALLREARPGVLASLMTGVVAGVTAFWHSLLHAPVGAQPAPSQRAPRDAAV
jgi:hypothetical protein